MLLESTTTTPASNNRRIQLEEKKRSESSLSSKTFKHTNIMNSINNNNIQITTPTTTPSPSTTCKARNQLLQLGIEMGNLCQKMLTCAPPFDPELHPPYHESSLKEQEPFWSSLHEKEKGNNENSHEKKIMQDDDCERREEVYGAIRSLFQTLVVFCDVCGIDLSVAIVKKMELNGKKYPVELCKGKSGKYTKYSLQTGITKTNQSTLDDGENQPQAQSNNDEGRRKSISDITLAIRQFALERNWSKYHTPRNITLAMMGEVGELAELFQWNSDICDNNHGDYNANGAENDVDCIGSIIAAKGGLKNDGWGDKEVDKVQQEAADVAIYCLRLADVVGAGDMGCSM